MFLFKQRLKYYHVFFGIFIQFQFTKQAIGFLKTRLEETSSASSAKRLWCNGESNLSARLKVTKGGRNLAFLGQQKSLSF